MTKNLCTKKGDAIENVQEQTFWGRPKGLKINDEIKKKISEGVKRAYAMKKEQYRKIQEFYCPHCGTDLCNEIRTLLIKNKKEMYENDSKQQKINQFLE